MRMLDCLPRFVDEIRLIFQLGVACKSNFRFFHPLFSYFVFLALAKAPELVKYSSQDEICRTAKTLYNSNIFTINTRTM